MSKCGQGLILLVLGISRGRDGLSHAFRLKNLLFGYEEPAGQLKSDVSCCTGGGIAAIPPAQAASTMIQARQSVCPPRHALAGRAPRVSTWIPAASAASMPRVATLLQVDESAHMPLLASQASDNQESAFRAPSLPLSLSACACVPGHSPLLVNQVFATKCEVCAPGQQSTQSELCLSMSSNLRIPGKARQLPGLRAALLCLARSQAYSFVVGC